MISTTSEARKPYFSAISLEDKSIFENGNIDASSIYEAFTGNRLYSYSQISLEPNLEKATDVWGAIEESADDAVSYMLGGEKETMKKLNKLEEQLQEIGGNL